MLTQICNGFYELVKEGIIHRDFKPGNVMIKGEKLKIGDFGLAKRIPSASFKNKTYAGTWTYMPLEIFKEL